MKATLQFLVILCGFSLPLCHAADPQDVSAQLEVTRAKYNLPGLTAMVIKDQRIVAQGQTGVREEGQSALLTTADSLNVGSCTKSMTAAIAGRLVDRGLISWNTRVRDVFQEYQTFNSAFWDVTLEQLLAHRGGVESGAAWEGAHIYALSQQSGTVQQVRRWAVQQALTDPPGGPVGQYIYSNQGYTTAGTMLEIVSGKSWETLVQEEVFDPLGMTTSRVGCTYDGTVPPPAPVGHLQSAPGGTPQVEAPYSAQFLAQYQGSIAPAGMVVTPMRDWARFLSVHLGHAPGYLKPATLKKMETPQGSEKYALGIFAVPQSWAGGTAFNHEGELFEETSVFWMAPAKDFLVMAFINCRIDPSNTTATDTVGEALNDVSLAMIEKYVTAPANGPLLDPASSFQFDSGDLVVTPAAHAVSLTVARPWPADSAASVGYTVTENSGGGTVDFGGPGSGTLNFRAGQASALISIPLKARSQPLGSRTFTVQLTAPSGENTIGTPSSLTVEVDDPPVVVTATASPSFGGSVTGGGSVAPGTSVSLQALPANGFKLVSWTENGVSLGTGNTLQITPDEDRNIVANFDLVSQTQIVAGDHTGAAAPGAGSVSGPPAGTVLSGFGLPALDDSGAMTSRVTLKAGHSSLGGIYRLPENGAASLAAWQGSTAPDAAPAVFKSFEDPVLAPGGSIAFVARLQGSGVHAGVDDLGLWTDAFGGALHLVLRTGQAVPGLPAGTLLKTVQGISLQDGEVAALVQFSHAAGIVTAANDVALLRVTGLQTVSVALRKGDSLGGSTVQSFSTFVPAPTSPGQGRWHTPQHLTATAVLANRTKALVQIAPGAAPVVRLQTGPDSAASFTVSSFGVPDGAAGALAVTASLHAAAGDAAAPHGLTLLAGEDGDSLTPVAGGGSSTSDFTTLSDPAINAAGKLAFLGTLKSSGAGPASLSSGLFTGSLSQAPALSAGLGLPAVDRYEHTNAHVLLGSIASFVLPDGSSAGPLFVGKLKGSGVTPANATGLWGTTSAGSWLLLLRAGEPVSLGAESKTVSGFSLFNALPGSFGARRSYNAAGAVAVLAKFTDGTQALLRLDLP